MRSGHLRSILILSGALVGAGCSSKPPATPDGARDGQSMVCDPQQCDQLDTDCVDAECQDNKCVQTPYEKGVRLEVQLQTAGDCMVRICDGQGKVTQIPDAKDLPNDNGGCIKYTCQVNGDKVTVVPENKAKGITCIVDAEQGSCDESGKCIALAGCTGDGDCSKNPCVEGHCVDKKCQLTPRIDGTQCGADQCQVCEKTVCGPKTCPSCYTCELGICVGCVGASKTCENGKCYTKQGYACASGAQCLSTFCVDDVCCDKACTDGCMACSMSVKEQGEDGKCEAVRAGIDPRSFCSDTAKCNGQGKCYCNDGNQNLGETDTDCGGPACQACGVGKKCLKDSDCQSKKCTLVGDAGAGTCS